MNHTDLTRRLFLGDETGFLNSNIKLASVNIFRQSHFFCGFLGNKPQIQVGQITPGPVCVSP